MTKNVVYLKIKALNGCFCSDAIKETFLVPPKSSVISSRNHFLLSVNYIFVPIKKVIDFKSV